MEDFYRQKQGKTWKVISKSKERIVSGKVIFLWVGGSVVQTTTLVLIRKSQTVIKSHISVTKSWFAVSGQATPY